MDKRSARARLRHVQSEHRIAREATWPRGNPFSYHGNKHNFRVRCKSSRQERENILSNKNSLFMPIYFFVRIFLLPWNFVPFVDVNHQVPCTLRWPYTEGNWLYCDYFIWCVSCTVVVVTFFCNVWVCVCGGVLTIVWVFSDMCTCNYCVLYCLYFVFVLFRLCRIYLYFFVLSVLV
jgi:hypothetical protein